MKEYFYWKYWYLMIRNNNNQLLITNKSDYYVHINVQSKMQSIEILMTK